MTRSYLNATNLKVWFTRLATLKWITLGVLVLSVSSSLRADPVTYVYTGTPFTTFCYGSNCQPWTAPGITGYITLSEPLAPNFAGFVYPWDGLTASPFTLESANFTGASGTPFASSAAASSIWIATASDGSISNYGIDAGQFELCSAGTSNPVCSGSPKYGESYQVNLTAGDYAIGGYGMWSIAATPVPEPATLPLIASGLAALTMLRRKLPHLLGA